MPKDFNHTSSLPLDMVAPFANKDDVARSRFRKRAGHTHTTGPGVDRHYGCKSALDLLDRLMAPWGALSQNHK